ncbi:hypothetical protein SLS55_001669 [Diplodia seriata]|uniref:Uncharacterized protein n=1 Tax=Diplodia seriata TaxID=420778 RepID=A0ABR3CQ51_9PEZI
MGLDQQLSEYAANGRNTRITLEYILRLSKYKVLRGESVAGSVEFQDHIEQLIDYCTREGLWRAHGVGVKYALMDELAMSLTVVRLKRIQKDISTDSITSVKVGN